MNLDVICFLSFKRCIILPFHIFADQVKLDIYEGISENIPDIGKIISIGNDGDGESIICDVKTGQADAIYGYGSFFYNEIPEGPRKFKAEKPAPILILSIHTNCCGVYMTLYHVTVEAPV